MEQAVADRQSHRKSLAKRAKHKPHRQRFYAALKRLYHHTQEVHFPEDGQVAERMRIYSPGLAGRLLYARDRALVGSIQAFEWFPQGDILAGGNWVLAVLLLQLLLWATWGFMAGTYGLYRLADYVAALPGHVLEEEVVANQQLSEYA